ncbi:sialate O-acetylesterase [soil metagenome]
MKYIIPGITALLFVIVSQAQVRLPKLVSDGMVLQRDTKIKIWGWGSAGEKVTVNFNKKKFKTTTDGNGQWMVTMPAQKSGGPFEMKIDASNHLTLKNILIGDVWLCSGQSNMQHQLKVHNITYEQDIANAENPEIRQFLVPSNPNVTAAQNDLKGGEWKQANPTNVMDFSAVAYFFARKLYEKYHVPIGIINASVGGTPIEAWTSEEGFKDFPAILKTIEKNKDTAYVNTTNRRAVAAMALQKAKPETDKGLTGSVKWYETNYVPKGWHQINIPGYWEDQGIKNLDGVVWYRREIDVPASMTGVPAKVFLGRIVDADELYINGQRAGGTGYQYPQRRYPLPAGMLKTGKNIFVVRVTNQSGKGGFVPDKPYFISANNQQIDLKGYWQYKVGDVFSPTGNYVPAINIQNQPTALYNSMIAPYINYAIKGFVWYQGESNVGNASEYAKLLPALINDWRNKWQQGDLPFLNVQLPNFQEVQYSPFESEWAVLREAQMKALVVPNTGMVVAIDLGEWNDIHPDNKKDVGNRLALAAEKFAYGENIVFSGPLYQSNEIAGNKIILNFTNTGSGLVSNDGELLSQFAIAGADKKFVWAKATIEGDKVIVWNETVEKPMYVRYAWADNPDGANLYNKEGLPASPFSTDQ